MSESRPSRRAFLAGATTLTSALWLEAFLPRFARASEGRSPSLAGPSGPIDLEIDRASPLIGGKAGRAITVNGSMPGPLIRLREGQDAVLRVSNRLGEDTSIHWHGLILPHDMDGVPGVSFAGIAPGETFEYSFPVTQSGTYWYHSHSGLQEQEGVFGPLIIDPIQPDPFEFDRDHVVMLSDWTFLHPKKVMGMLKKSAGVYNYQRRTVGDVLSEKDGMTLRDSARWGRMRMDPTDIADVTGVRFTYLMNGLAPGDNWTGRFRPGERVRLRLINAAAMTYFDVRIPGLEMTVVAVDGQNVEPVTVDEIRVAVAETYDVIVHPNEEGAFTVFAETMDRSGYARGTLASSAGLSAAVPPLRRRGVRTMADMGMDMAGMDMAGMEGEGHEGMDMAGMEAKGHEGMDMAGMEAKGHEGMDMSSKGAASQEHEGMGMGGAGTAAQRAAALEPGPELQPHKRHGAGATGFARNPRPRLHERGIGLEDAPWRVLTYADLGALSLYEDQRSPTRDLELHLTGNMERYMWSFDGKKYTEVSGPILFTLGERLRLILVNDTMMEHPIHLHGMWMELEGTGRRFRPRKHTISVKPGEKLAALITVDAPGDWAFHCHLLYHMDMGMFRVVSVRPPAETEMKELVR